MTEMLKDESTRKKFVDDSVNFLKKFEFDGLDLDFECMLNAYFSLFKSVINLLIKISIALFKYRSGNK